MKNVRDCIILTSAAGGGKTTARLVMENFFKKGGLSCNLISDGECLLRIVEEDKEGQWHTLVPESEGKSTFLITHQFPYDEILRRWAAIVPEPRERQINLIEVARGVGYDYPDFDVSYGRMLEMNLVSRQIWERAIVIYLDCPRELRFAWNEGRRGTSMSSLDNQSFFVPPEVMKSLFFESDFMDKLFPKLEEMGIPVYLLENDRDGIEIFRHQVETLSRRISREHFGQEGQLAGGKERRQ